MRIPDAIVYSQIDALPGGGDVLKSLRVLLGICFEAVITSITSIIEGR